MNERTDGHLKDIVKLGNGKIKPSTLGEIPIYGGNGILGYCDKSNYEDETVVIGRVGAYCGSVYYSNKPIWVSDNALAAKPTKDYSAKYIYYLLKNLNLNNYAEGSSHPLVTQGLLNSIELIYHKSATEQQAIAEVLSSLDDKIDLLHRNNKTLEEMAETLFRQWFVEGAKEDWEVVQIGDLCIRITKGTTPTTMGKKFYDSGINFIKAESIEDHGSFNKSKFAFIDQETHEMLSRSQLKAGDVLYTIAGTIGRTCIVTESILPANTNQAVAILKNDTNKISSLFLKYLMKSDIIKEVLDSKVVHAVQPNLSLGEISSTSLSLPPKTLLDRFDLIVQSIADKINSNSNQLEHLINTRDTLLPKLMSGQVKVNLNA